MGTGAMAWVKVRGQLWWVASLLYCEFWELNSGCVASALAWWSFRHLTWLIFKVHSFAYPLLHIEMHFWAHCFFVYITIRSLKFLGTGEWPWGLIQSKAWPYDFSHILTIKKNYFKTAVNEIYFSFKGRIKYIFPSIKKASEWLITYWICLIWGNLGWNALLVMESEIKQ